MRDPFYAEIERALAGPLDSDLLEALAAELVGSKGYPTCLVVGGADNGYDFELVDSSQEPGPGVVTTSGRVTSNLKRNLERNKANCPGAAKKTYVVTSSVLTSKKRDNLKKAAADLGYIYLGAADRHEVARYIYANPRWAKDLLGLTGAPSALSMVPRTSRPLLDVPIVGRETTEQSLRDLHGDVLVVGSPGSGKTTVLARLVADGLGSFMISRDMTSVANAVRQQQPEMIIIDDLDDAVAAARDLLQLRQEVGASFRIVVTDWERNPELEQALGLTNDGIVALGRLTRDEIVSVLQSVGIGGPRVLVREIVDQADGVPGLAVTLSQAALAGDYKALFDGDRLGSLMEATVNRLLGDPREGDKSTLALASIALAGDAGLTLEATASFLGLSKVKLQALLRRLSSGGIVRSDANRVTVRPRPLRRYMIRKAFFGTGAADYSPLLKVVPNLGQSVIELVKVSHLGVVVPNLLEMVLRSEDTQAARYYVGSGERQAREYLRVAPTMSADVAHEALHTAPDAVIPQLLASSVDDHRALHSTPEHPLRQMKDWANSAKPGSGEVIQRKRMLVTSALDWAARGNDFATTCRACTEVLRTSFDTTETDPGGGMTIHLISGMLTVEEIGELAPLWEKLKQAIQAAIQAADDIPWEPLLSLAWSLVHPGTYGGRPQAAHEASRQLGERVIADLGSLADGHPAVLERLNHLRSNLGITEAFEVPYEYDVLFGELDSSDWRAKEEQRGRQIAEIADQWVTSSPERFAAHMKWLHDEAALVEGRCDRSPRLYQLLAEKVTNPEEWLHVLVNASLSPDCLLPFLDRVALCNGEEWEVIVRPMLGDPVTASAAIDVALRAAGMSDGMWACIAPILPGHGRHIEGLCLRKQMSTSTLRRVLEHESTDITSATAVGMWMAAEEGKMPKELRRQWEDAVVRINDKRHNHWVRQMLESNPRVAARWLQARIDNANWMTLLDRSTVESACKGLNRDERLTILRSLPGDSRSETVGAMVVGDNQDLYREVLQNQSAGDNWQYPLRREPDDQWRVFAGIALKEGKAPREVASASGLRSDSWIGPYSAYLQAKIDAWSPWLNDSDSGIAETAQLLIEYFSQMREQALADERRESIEGLR